MYHSNYNRSPEEREPIIETDQFQVCETEPEQPRKKKAGFAAKFVAVGLCCALVGGLAGVGGMLAYSHFSGGTAVLYEGTRPTAVSLASVDGKTVLTSQEVYASNLESVVGVNGDVTTNVWGYTVRNAVSGSGFVISSNDTTSYILTNYHVIDGVSDITVSFADGSTYDATLVGGEEENDIAVLSINVGGLRPVVLGDSDAISVGEPVYAIGNPLGELTFTFTGGFVSAKDRSITMSDGTIMNMIQTDTAINSGNSGGPLFDQYGQVVGIVSAKYSSSGSSTEASVEGIGFAIPINDVKDMVTSIMEYGYVTGKPNVGIIMSDVPQTAQQYGIPSGAEVKAVLDGSCADKGGLQVGDIITAVDDSAVTSSDQLQSAVKNYKAGDTVTFTVYRDGVETTIQLTLDEADQDREAAMTELQEEYQSQQTQSQQSGNSYSFPFSGW